MDRCSTCRCLTDDFCSLPEGSICTDCATKEINRLRRILGELKSIVTEIDPYYGGAPLSRMVELIKGWDDHS